MTKFYDIAESFSYICCPFGTMLFIGIYDFSKLCVSANLVFPLLFRSKKVPVPSSLITRAPLWSSSILHVNTALRCKQITSSYMGLRTLMRTLDAFPPAEVSLKHSSATSVSCQFCLLPENQSSVC